MLFEQKKEWDKIWQRENIVDALIGLGRRVYNNFWKNLLLHKLKPNSEVLEVGCGSASLLISIMPKIGRAVGVDISEVAIKRATEDAKKRHVSNFCFEIGDCQSLRFVDEFDLVWSQGLLEHFDNPKKVLAEHFKAAKPGGRILVSVPYKYSYMYIWYLLTRFKIFCRFWPWTDQVFFTHKELAVLAQGISNKYRVFLLKPAILGVIILEIQK